jgi:hypothetical protein
MATSNFLSSQIIKGVGAANTPFEQFDIGVVHTVILKVDDIKKDISDNDINYKGYSISDFITKDGLYYGAIYYRLIGGGGTEVNESDLPHAFPLKREFLALPVKDELVKIYKSGGKDYYEKITPENSPNFNTAPDLVISTTKLTKEGSGSDNTSKADTYAESNATNIPNSAAKGETETIRAGFSGKYFKKNMNIHQLAMNEGDTLLQGRFGNSIRFSGYIHDDKDNGTQYPAILIRNGENSDNQQKKIYDVVTEDINKDGTSIQITSGKYKTLLSPTVKVAKQANDQYPSSDQLIGDQLVVNSGRVIVSSKTAETFLFSKKKFSIFTDDVVTIDTEKGYKLISQNGNIEISARHNKNIIFGVATGGKIFHGRDGADQQAILGNKLVDLLGQLIDAINVMQFQTFFGPTFPGPMDKATLNTIKAQLKTTLSKNNYLI